MLISQTLKYVIIVVLFQQSLQYVKNRNSDILLSNIVDMQLSHDSQYLVAHNSTHIGFYHAIFGKSLKVLKVQSQIKAMSFRNNKNQVFFGDSNAQTYSFEYSQLNQTEFKINKKHLKLMQNSQDFQPIADICVSADDKFLFILFNQGTIISTNLQQDGVVAYGYYSKGLPLKIACSQTNQNLLAVSGTQFVTKNNQLSLYQINIQSLQILQKIPIVQLANIDNINFMVIGSNNSLYVSGNKQSIIYKYQYPLYDKQNIFYVRQGTNEQFYKFYVNLDQTQIALSTKNSLVIAYKNKQNQRLAADEIYETCTNTFAISKTGERVSFVNQNSAYYLSKCQYGYFLKQNVCQKCISGCGQCLLNNSICFQCQGAYYLYQNACMRCFQNCATCSNSTTCQKCQQQFVETNGICRQAGIKLWILAIIIIGVIVIMCLIIIFNIVMLKRNTKKHQDEKLLSHDKQQVQYS